MDMRQTPKVWRKTLHVLDILVIFLESGFRETLVAVVNHLGIKTPVHSNLLQQGLILLHFGDGRRPFQSVDAAKIGRVPLLHRVELAPGFVELLVGQGYVERLNIGIKLRFHERELPTNSRKEENAALSSSSHNRSKR